MYGVAPANEIPNVYNASGPSFKINADLWRITWKTVEYFKNQSSGYRNRYLYFVAPLNIGVRRNDAGVHGIDVVAIIKIPEEVYGVYSFGLSAAVKSDNFTSYYNLSENHDYVSGYPYLMSGKGAYVIAVSGIGCFNMTIEEYY